MNTDLGRVMLGIVAALLLLVGVLGTSWWHGQVRVDGGGFRAFSVGLRSMDLGEGEHEKTKPYAELSLEGNESKSTWIMLGAAVFFGGLVTSVLLFSATFLSFGEPDSRFGHTCSRMGLIFCGLMLGTALLFVFTAPTDLVLPTLRPGVGMLVFMTGSVLGGVAMWLSLRRPSLTPLQEAAVPYPYATAPPSTRPAPSPPPPAPAPTPPRPPRRVRSGRRPVVTDSPPPVLRQEMPYLGQSPSTPSPFASSPAGPAIPASRLVALPSAWSGSKTRLFTGLVGVVVLLGSGWILHALIGGDDSPTPSKASPLSAATNDTQGSQRPGTTLVTGEPTLVPSHEMSWNAGLYVLDSEGTAADLEASMLEDLRQIPAYFDVDEAARMAARMTVRRLSQKAGEAVAQAKVRIYLSDDGTSLIATTDETGRVLELHGNWELEGTLLTIHLIVTNESGGNHVETVEGSLSNGALRIDGVKPPFKRVASTTPAARRATAPMPPTTTDRHTSPAPTPAPVPRPRAEHRPAPSAASGGKPLWARVARWQLSEAKRLGTPVAFEDALGMRFVLIPAGSFVMGSTEGGDQERPIHQVTISRPFYLSIHEVTQKQWDAVMGSNASKFRGDDRPVDTVRWDDCQTFLAARSKRVGGAPLRLPSEAEWEFACRADSSTAYHFSNDPRLLDAYAWYEDNSGGATHPVGQKRPNDWGLYDMHGNVWEWCRDGLRTYGNRHVVDPVGPTGSTVRHAYRGGAWYFDAGAERSARRHDGAPHDRYDSLGLRVVQDILDR